MYLQHRNRLTIGTIARGWARERSGEDEHDVVSDLLQAFWLGHLVGVQPAEGQPYLTRCRALALLISSREEEQHPGIAICRTEAERSSMVTHQDDGIVVVDIRAGILLPEDQDGWTPRIKNEAYQTLAELAPDDYAEAFIALFRMMTLSKVAFLDFLRRRDLKSPAFWYSPRDPMEGITEAEIKTHRAGAPADVRAKRGRKPKYDYEAIDAFLDRRRLAEGRAAFADQTALFNDVRNHFGTSRVPGRSQFQKHLTRYVADHFSP